MLESVLTVAVSFTFGVVSLYAGKLALVDPEDFLMASPRFRRQGIEAHLDNPFVIFFIRLVGILLLLTGPMFLFFTWLFLQPVI